MDTKKTPAFPFQHTYPLRVSSESGYGINKTEYYAAKAMQAIITGATSRGIELLNFKQIALDAFTMAEEMASVGDLYDKS